MRSRTSSLEAEYRGKIEKDEVQFAKVIILEPRAVCDDHSRIERDLPVTSDPSERPMLREAGGEAVENRSPVKIDLHVYDKLLKINKTAAWDGYPENIMFMHEWKGPPAVFYRTGPGENDIRNDTIESDLNWVCRSRTVYFGSIILIPFAVAFDIVTFPVQLVLVIWGH